MLKHEELILHFLLPIFQNRPQLRNILEFSKAWLYNLKHTTDLVRGKNDYIKINQKNRFKNNCKDLKSIH